MILLNTWCDNHDSFQGFHSIKVSASALATLYMSQDPRLLNMMVKGDLVPAQPGSTHPCRVLIYNTEIVTRSMARSNPDTYASIPVPAKILKLLIAELENRLEADARVSQQQTQDMGDDGDDGEGEDWEDVDEPSEDEYGFLSGKISFTIPLGLIRVIDLVGEKLDIEEVDEDPIDKDDPMYTLDLKVFNHAVLSL